VNLEPAVPAHGISVAIVDDELTVRVSLRRLCQALGLSATVYASGRDFIEALDAGIRVDCVLLDAHMPQMSGLELQRHLADLGTRFPTVVYTADDAPEAQARYLAAGVDAYLQKPVGGEELLDAITRAIAPRGH
jgi:FixJ family two-component response regulator